MEFYFEEQQTNIKMKIKLRLDVIFIDEQTEVKAVFMIDSFSLIPYQMLTLKLFFFGVTFV